MDADLKAFRELMLALWHHHEKPWEYSNAQAQKIYEAIGSGFVSLGNESEVEELLPSESSVEREFDNRYLYLNPVTHGTVMVPVLTLKAVRALRPGNPITCRLILIARRSGSVFGLQI